MRSATTSCFGFMGYLPLALTLRPGDAGDVQAKRVAHESVARSRGLHLDLKNCFPSGGVTARIAAEVLRLLGPTDLVAARRDLEDRVDVYADGLMLGELEGIIGVQVVVEEFVGRSPGVGMKLGQPLGLHRRVAADRPRV